MEGMDGRQSVIIRKKEGAIGDSWKNWIYYPTEETLHSGYKNKGKIVRAQSFPKNLVENW